MKVSSEGSVRVDLLGGTLDLNPINIILENVVTINVATSLKAKVTIESSEKDGVELESIDYGNRFYFSKKDFTPEKLRGDHFGPMKFVCQILDYLELKNKVKITLESGSPPGAGLGGSSAMGVTLYSAIKKFRGEDLERMTAIKEVNAIEARILDAGPAGYQDYYPALFGGVLALTPNPSGVEVEQLYSDELKQFLENHLTLVYSGQTRLSGINNWEVYKKFFDKVALTREGLEEIARLSFQAYEALMAGNLSQLLELISLEGESRKNLFPGILSSSMSDLHSVLQGIDPSIGLKVCGAGGGGCFLLVHQADKKEAIKKAVDNARMKILKFEVERPL